MSNNSQNIVTDTHHNDFVSGEASMGRIPGSEKSTTRHNFVSVFPKEGEQKRHASGVNRPDEHLPLRGVDQPFVPADQGSFTERLTTTRPHQTGPVPQVQQTRARPLTPVPDSRTVIDRDPFASPATAADTMTGSTSQDVYESIGKPANGMASAEVHHNGQHHRKRQGLGKDQYGNADEMWTGWAVTRSSSR